MENGTSTSNGSETPSQPKTKLASRDILVFQCHTCRSLVGDSSALILADNSLKIIALRAVSCVSLSFMEKDLETSKTGTDIGSTYYSFSCAHCRSTLGRVYQTTNPQIDYIRNYFAFDLNAILSYKTGSYNQISSRPSIETSPSSRDFQRQETQLTKVQQMLLLFCEKLDSLEHGFSANEEDSPDETPLTPLSRSTKQKRKRM